MPEEESVGCARPTSQVAGDAPKDETPEPQEAKETNMAQVQVGKPAPDFKAPAYRQGKFTQVSLSEYAGKWVLLCFYPGDFTFV